MTTVTVAIPRLVHYIAPGFGPQEPNHEGLPAEHLTARDLIPQKARHVCVHEA
jgi:hypothetical protein